MVPWIGVLMAARSACERIARFSLWISGKGLYLPISVRVQPGNNHIDTRGFQATLMSLCIFTLFVRHLDGSLLPVFHLRSIAVPPEMPRVHQTISQNHAKNSRVCVKRTYRSRVSVASSTDTFQSLDRPRAVLPYAMEKFKVFALRRSDPNTSCQVVTSP